MKSTWPSLILLLLLHACTTPITDLPPSAGPVRARGQAQGEVVVGAPSCVTLQRGLAGNVSDTYLRNEPTTKLFGASTLVNAGRIAGASETTGVRWALLRWELGVVPANATITSATVTLVTTGNNGVAGSMDVHAAQATWAEPTATWTTFQKAIAPAVEATFANGGVYFVGPLSFDLTALVVAWHSGTAQNHGIALTPHDATNANTFFNSSEAATVSVRPKLVVCYTQPIVATDAGAVTDTSGVDAGPAPELTSPAPVDVSVPQPVEGHPRLVFSAADLPRLRSWATASNPMWQSLMTLKSAVDHRALTLGKWNTNQPNIVTGYVCDKATTFCDSGSAALTNDIIEEYALFYAFLSLVDNDPTMRSAHADVARRMLMYVMNLVAQGLVPDAQGFVPFRSTRFAWWNRANWGGEAWGLVVDWLYPYFSKAELATIQKGFLLWNDVLIREGQALTTWSQLKGSLANLGNVAMVGDPQHARHAWNNYNAGQVQRMVSQSLALDAVDDPPLAGQGTLYPTVRGYLAYVEGANWLQYQLFLGQGGGQGGVPAEGAFGYGTDTLKALATSRLLMRSSGHPLPPSVSGFADSAFWSNVADGILASTANQAIDVGQGLGMSYPVANFNQVVTDIFPELMQTTLVALAVYEQRLIGTPPDPLHAARYQKLLWMATHLPPGGLARLYQRPKITGNVWNGVGAWTSLLYFLAFDPTVDPATLPDPRPGMSTAFTDAGLGRVLARTGWDASARWFGSLCQYMSLDHQHESGHFFFHRKGEWITRPRSGYSNSGVTDGAQYNNELAIQNVLPNGDPNLIPAWFRGPFLSGAPVQGSTGDPVASSSRGSGFTYSDCQMTPLYNLKQSFNGAVPNEVKAVTHASRSVVWLEPDHVVVYDRATTSQPDLFKRFHLFLHPTDPTVDAATRTLSGLTPGGQRYWVKTLLPEAAATTHSVAEGVADATESAFEPFFSSQGNVTRRGQVYTVSDPSNPLDERLLHVLEVADGGAVSTPTALVLSAPQSTATFEGARIGPRIVWFRRDLGGPAGPLVWSVPAGVTTQVVTGLAANTSYQVAMTPAPGGHEVTVTAGPGATTDGAGVLVIATP